VPPSDRAVVAAADPLRSGPRRSRMQTRTKTAVDSKWGDGVSDDGSSRPGKEDDDLALGVGLIDDDLDTRRRRN